MANKCSKCKNNSIIELKYCGLSLCKKCYIKFFEKRVANTMKENNYLENANKIAVALSGGKDSVTTLYLLNKLIKRKISLVAISIDSGIKGYDEKLLENAKKLCTDLNIVHYIFSFKDELGYTTNEIVKQKLNPCICGVFRRYLLNKKSRELGADKLATGHNLNDEVESVIMNLIRGDVDRIARGDGLVKNEKFIPRIKPLQKSPENEVALYAGLVFPKFNFNYECPYRKEVLRANIKRLMKELEAKHDGILFQIYEGNKRLRESLLKSINLTKSPNECMSCGEMTSNEVCQACDLKAKIHEFLKK